MTRTSFEDSKIKALAVVATSPKPQKTGEIAFKISRSADYAGHLLRSLKDEGLVRALITGNPRLHLRGETRVWTVTPAGRARLDSLPQII
jgi:hypothetical protein